MAGLRTTIGAGGPVVADSDERGWRLIVRGVVVKTGVLPCDLHEALRALALRERELAEDAFGVVCNCLGAWEDEYTEEHGEDAISLDAWLELIEFGGVTIVSDDGELITGVAPEHDPSSPGVRRRWGRRSRPWGRRSRARSPRGA